MTTVCPGDLVVVQFGDWVRNGYRHNEDMTRLSFVILNDMLKKGVSEPCLVVQSHSMLDSNMELRGMSTVLLDGRFQQFPTRHLKRVDEGGDR